MEIEDFIYQHEGCQKEIMLYFHHFLTQELGLTSKYRYKLPFYYQKSWICYLHPTKKGTVELAFIRGNELSNIQGLLDSKDRKQVYSIEFSDIKETQQDAIAEIIHEAILLDESVPYASKRKKN